MLACLTQSALFCDLIPFPFFPRLRSTLSLRNSAATVNRGIRWRFDGSGFGSGFIVRSASEVALLFSVLRSFMRSKPLTRTARHLGRNQRRQQQHHCHH